MMDGFWIWFWRPIAEFLGGVVFFLSLVFAFAAILALIAAYQWVRACFKKPVASEGVK
jgi:hypothetical protein